MHVRFTKREELAPYIWRYSFTTDSAYDYVAGQYTNFHFKHPLHDPRGQSRVFTLTSVPGELEISFVAKFLLPMTPYKQALQALQPGDELTIDDAMGDLVLPKLASVPMVFIAGGIGMASYVSMLRLLTQAKEERPIFFFYALRSPTEVIYKELIEAYPLTHKQFVYAPNRLQAQEILASTPPDALLYLSGSQRFVEGLRQDFEAAGIPRSQIVFDYYDGYAEL
jgi:ferredoxin-NADP reductase